MNRSPKFCLKQISLMVAACVLGISGLAAALLPLRFAQDGPVQSKSGLAGNDIGDIVWDGRHLWVGTDGGVSRLKPFQSGQWATDWDSYGVDQGIGHEGVSALAVSGDTVWIATVHDTLFGNQEVQAGDGLSVSFDRGTTWHHFSNDDIFGRLKGGPPTPVQNGAFGLALDGGTIWATFFAGSLVRSSDGGQSWERVLPDGAEEIRYGDDRKHRTFSVAAYEDTLWVGTSEGLARSLDGGATWDRFSFEADQNGRPIEGTLSGNWIVALAGQRLDGQTIIWAGVKTTDRPAGQSQRVSISRDNGETWERTGLGLSAWNFAFQDTLVWATTEDGLFSSAWVRADGQLSTEQLRRPWSKVSVEDPVSRETLTGDFVGVAVADTVLWVGSERGIGRSGDLGKHWRIFKSPVKTPSLDRGEVVTEGGESEENTKTYAYPNPFSPLRGDRVRLQYSLSEPAQVTIKIYDFASRLVKVLIEDGSREGPADHGENWDGRNGVGDLVANGVYFYTVETDRGDQASGKIVVLD